MPEWAKKKLMESFPKDTFGIYDPVQRFADYYVSEPIEKSEYIEPDPRCPKCGKLPGRRPAGAPEHVC